MLDIRNGDILPLEIMARRDQILEEVWIRRFMEKIEPCPASGCWLWTGAIRGDGYGAFRPGIRPRPQEGAHRLAWQLWRETDIANMQVLHRCDVPLCVNPDHLFLGTHQDNVNDKCKKGRTYHPGFGTQHHSSKLTPDQVIAIRNDTRTQKVIAKDYGINRTSVSRILRSPKYV